MLQQQKRRASCARAERADGTGAHSSYAARKDSQGHELADFFRSTNAPGPIFSAACPLIPADRVCSNSREHNLENFQLMERRSAYDWSSRLLPFHSGIFGELSGFTTRLRVPITNLQYLY